MINWAKLGVEKSFQNHFHEDMQEIFIILKGKALITIDKEEAVLEKGDAVSIAPGQPHMMKNICAEDVEYIVVGVSEGKDGKTVVL